ncbi:MAG: AraC family transcriptional regulator [Peptococcaceae bacterium]|jgi:serine kinase of HPr protein (carbohydrate metabolism regulator)|nr:AraC family transcriptional regulator [Peptococcaceae bacterium]
MRIKAFAEALNLRLLTDQPDGSDISVSGCYLGDLLSNVMAKVKEGDLWMTVVTNQNVVAVAHLMNVPAVVFLEGHQPMPETLERGNSEKIPLFSSEESAYGMAVRFHRFLPEAEGEGMP